MKKSEFKQIKNNLLEFCIPKIQSATEVLVTRYTKNSDATKPQRHEVLVNVGKSCPEFNIKITQLSPLVPCISTKQETLSDKGYNADFGYQIESIDGYRIYISNNYDVGSDGFYDNELVLEVTEIKTEKQFIRYEDGISRGSRRGYVPIGIDFLAIWFKHFSEKRDKIIAQGANHKIYQAMQQLVYSGKGEHS